MVISGVLSELSPEKPASLFEFLIAIAIFVLNFFIEIGLIAFALKAHDDVSKVSVHDLWHTANFWKFVGTRILTIIIVLVGLILLIVPGIIAALALMFATYVVVDRGFGPIEAIKESVRLTKGHRWELFLLALALIGLNILGAIALLVGLLVTIPSIPLRNRTYVSEACSEGSIMSVVIYTDGGARGNHQSTLETHGFPTAYGLPSSTGKQGVFPTPFPVLGCNVILHTQII